MPGLLYYLPGRDRSIKLPQVRALGLGHAFEERLTACGVTRGPDGGAGVVVADHDRTGPARIRYDPDRQRWRPIPNPQSAIRNPQSPWVGCYADTPPRPADLSRTRQLGGHWVALRGGGEFLVPVARAMAEEEGTLGYFCPLPASTSIDAAGHWIRGELEECDEQLWQIAQAWWDARTGAVFAPGESPGVGDDEKAASRPPTSISFDFAGEHDCALAALARNYRLGPAEVALLGIFDPPAVARVLDALIDWQTVLEFLKKKVALDT